MSAIDYAILLNRIESLDILLNKCEYNLQDYLKILTISIYSRKIKTFEFILKFLLEKGVLEKFSFEFIFKIMEKIIIIHQFEKHHILIQALKDIKEKLQYDLIELEHNINLLILSAMSMKIFKLNCEKSLIGSSKEFSFIFHPKDENGEIDYDDFEDEIREKIINNVKNNENMYNKPNKVCDSQNDNNNNNNTNNDNSSNINNLQNFNTKNIDSKFSTKEQMNICHNNEIIIRFEDYLENNIKDLVQIKIIELTKFRNTLKNEPKSEGETEITKNQSEFKTDQKKEICSQKFLKLLFIRENYESLRLIFKELEKISILINFKQDELLKKEFTKELDTDSEKDNFHQELINNIVNISNNNNEEKLNYEYLEKINNKNIKPFISDILFESQIIIKQESFEFIYSLNKRKKEDNYYESWKKSLYNFNNHNILSFIMKSIFNNSLETNKCENNILIDLLNSKILSLLLFLKLKNNKNILHLIFPKTNTKEVLHQILLCIKANFPKSIKNLISMIDSTDNNNLTPIDIAIKKKNYDMVEVFTKILNDFFINNILVKINSDIKEEINTNNSIKNFMMNINNYTDNILYKIVSYSVKDVGFVTIPEDYKVYIKTNRLNIETSIKNLNSKFNSQINSEKLEKNNLDYYKSGLDSNQHLINKEKTKKFEDFINNQENLCFNKSFGLSAIMLDILNRNSFIIKAINENRIFSHFNLNQKQTLAMQVSENKNTLEEFKSNFYWVDTIEKLESCIQHLKSVKYIGVDLEFHNFKACSSSNGIVCVVQLSSIEKTFAIDSLILDQETIRDSIKPIFEDEKILKIFHGCDNDLAFLISNYQIFTRNFIDTGRTYLAFQNHILNRTLKTAQLPSLSYLARLFLNCELDKSYQKADWRIRPLTKNMLSYALSDAKIVIYIFEIFVGLYNYLNENIFENNLRNDNRIYISEEFNIAKNAFYENLIKNLRENKLSEKELKLLNESSVSDKKQVQNNNGGRFYSLLLESILRSLEIINQKINFEYRKIEVKLN